MAENIVILGVGNLLMSDDGVGAHAAHALEGCPPEGVTVADVGTDFLSALPFLESADRVLVIDAVRGRGEPGSVYRLAEADIELPGAAATLHARNLLSARTLLSPGAVWPKIEILGIEPSVLDYGMVLSPPVAAALKRVVALARDITSRWKTRTEVVQP